MRSLCLKYDLCLFHNSRPTYFDIAHRATSMLDLWLVSDRSKVICSNQIQCPSISHHALIYAVFAFNIEHSFQFIEYRDFNNINYDTMFLCLDGFDSQSFFGTSDVNIQWNSHLFGDM